jgi:lipopolysaccharide/colanic/teichoic acid biosynthesis glycosyltransferase
MKIKRIIDALRAASRPSVEGIQPEEIFKAILKHERAVAERNSHVITVLVFYTMEGQLGTETAPILGRILADRLRATDLIGWLDSRSIGVILPHTGVKDATLVADQICRKMVAHQVKLEYKFYLHPHDECEKWDKQPEQPLTKSSNASPSSRAGHEMSHLDGVASGGVSESMKTEGRRVCALPLADICVLPFPAWKRVLDILLCLFGLIVFGPAMVLIAIGVKIIAPGPVLFRQERIGFRGKPFVLFKFRSMKLNADTGVHKDHLAQLMKSDVSMTKLDKVDARLIPFGKIFRASGFDELPQLFNIIRGDMSFIGPRPCVPYEYEQFIPWHKRRCETLPGLTGLWQVSGKNKTTFTEMMRLDINYGRRRTLLEDLRILVQTIPAVMVQIRESSTMKR